MGLKLANNAISVLTSSLTAGATSVALAAGTGSRFPTLGAGDYFPATISKPDGSNEIVRVTARSGDTLTATRAQEGTTALAFDAGSLIELRLTAATIDDINNYPPSKAGAGAYGTWSISVTGSAGSVSWSNVSGRPAALSAFTNDVGYVTSSGSVNYATSAGSANSVAWGNVSGRPTALSSFSNDSGYITSSGNASKLNPLSGDSNYKLAYTADGARTNAGEWGRAVMYYVPNGQTYGIRVDRADYADSAGNGGVTSVNGKTGAVTVNAQAFTAGTLMLFQQTAAPTGWTKQTTHDNKALRVVSGTAGSGGSVAFTTAFAASLSANATTLSTAQMPSHSHTATAYYYKADPPAYGLSGFSQAINGWTVTTSSQGSGDSHTHSLPSFAVQYVDLIIASKD